MATNPAAQVLGSAPGVKLSFISVMRELAVCHHPGEDSIPWSRVSRIRDLVSSIEYLVGTIASRRGEAFQSCMSLQQCAALSRVMVSACLTAAPRSSWRNLGGLPSPLFWFESPPPNHSSTKLSRQPHSTLLNTFALIVCLLNHDCLIFLFSLHELSHTLCPITLEYPQISPQQEKNFFSPL